MKRSKFVPLQWIKCYVSGANYVPVIVHLWKKNQNKTTFQYKNVLLHFVFFFQKFKTQTLKKLSNVKKKKSSCGVAA